MEALTIAMRTSSAKRRVGYFWHHQADMGVPDITPGTWEFDVMNCAHCQRTVILNPERKRDRNECKRCDRYVCDNPGCIETCVHRDEATELALRNVGASVDFLGRAKDGALMFEREVYLPPKSFSWRGRTER